MPVNKASAPERHSFPRPAEHSTMPSRNTIVRLLLIALWILCVLWAGAFWFLRDGRTIEGTPSEGLAALVRFSAQFWPVLVGAILLHILLVSLRRKADSSDHRRTR